MLALARLATLEIAAASGLVEADGRIFVVADDDHGLLALGSTDCRPLARVQLFPGELPVDPGERKRQKPDLEALCWLPGRGLFALGSGSRDTRHRGVFVSADLARVEAVELAGLHAAIAHALGDVELNLEAAALVGDRLILGQRGNGRGARDALIHVDLAAFLRGEAKILALHDVTLGELGGVRLTLTDACAFADGLLVSAAAEASPDAYQDGAVVGSALAWLGLDGSLRKRYELEGVEKIEGLAVRADGSLLLCVDADDPLRPSSLYTARLP